MRIEDFTNRRHVLSGAALLSTIALLPACATTGGLGGGVEEALRRLLMISSERAVTRLVAPGGYMNDAVARVTLPSSPDDRSGAVLGALISSRPAQNAILTLVNRAAGEAAARAAPLLYDSIRRMSFADALSIARGGPTAATDFLERSTGDAIVQAMFPEVGSVLRGFDSGSILGPVLGAATGVNVTGLSQVVSQQAARGLWRAIGREEAAIRADPRSAGDPLVSSVFGAGRFLQ